MSRPLPVLAFALVALGLSSCKDSGVEVRVGVKRFTEQRILGQMVRARLQAERIPVDALVECGDTVGCQRAIAAGDVDVLIEYTGTAAAFAARPGTDDFASVAQVMQARGQTWLKPFGFDNGYRVLVTPERAATLTDLADLAAIKPLRVIAPAEFLRRPRDGLGALAARYGLTLAPQPLVIESPVERFAALRHGRGDVAIGYATDGAITDFQLVALRDSADFFPSYEAAIVVRSKRLNPRIEKALRPLSGRLSTLAMRSLNARVELQGRRPATVARRYLARNGLLTADAVADQSAPPLIIAAGPVYAKAARRVAREAFPARAVRLVDAAPRDAIPGKARLAVLPADVLAETEGVVAATVIGRAWVHAVRQTGAGLDGRLGVEPTASAALKQRASRVASAPELFAAVRDGRLDVALVRAPLGDPGITDALKSGLILTAVDAALPLHQRARIAAGTYPGQAAAVETLSTQVLLAGPGRGRLAQASGPSGAVGSGAAPLTAAQRSALIEAAAVPEMPDPALPRAEALTEASDDPAWLDGLLNLLVVLFMVWWAKVLAAPTRADEGDAA